MTSQNDVLGIDLDSLAKPAASGHDPVPPDTHYPILGELDLCLVQDLRNGTIFHNGTGAWPGSACHVRSVFPAA